MTDDPTPIKRNFLYEAIDADIASGQVQGKIITRFPPEPNGYLHIGHTKAICINFGIAQHYNGQTHLRMDDTNPVKEEQEYIDAIQDDIRWLGFTWDRLCFASDYFEQLYDWAIVLIQKGHAYVDDQTVDQIRANRGNLTEPGTASPWRDRPIEESLDLFARMKAGEFPDGSRVLRAKINMADPNLVMRDPVLYRILHATHPRTGDTWCIYPMYDWAHGQSDWIEGITHSMCDISFEIHRPLYDWCINRLAEENAYPPGITYKTRQMEFARGNITTLITSKRKLLQLVTANHVTGWDDPRMPTLRGMRRRGYPAMAIRRFWEEAGVAKRENLIEFAKLESLIREELNRTVQRRMAILDPLKVIITNYPEDQIEQMSVINNPEDETAGRRDVPFSRELFIERSDFMEDPPRKFFRLGPGKEVRLRSAYWVTCTDVIKDDQGNVTELHCTYDPDTKGGKTPPDGRKVKGTLHWVSAAHALDAEVRIYDPLFLTENPEQVEEGKIFLDNLNPDSAKTLKNVKVEPALADTQSGDRFQFERTGYFCTDSDSTADKLVFNRTATLRDTWAKVQKQPNQQKQKQKKKQQQRSASPHKKD